MHNFLLKLLFIHKKYVKINRLDNEIKQYEKKQKENL